MQTSYVYNSRYKVHSFLKKVTSINGVNIFHMTNKSVKLYLNDIGKQYLFTVGI